MNIKFYENYLINLMNDCPNSFFDKLIIIPLNEIDLSKLVHFDLKCWYSNFHQIVFETKKNNQRICLNINIPDLDKEFDEDEKKVIDKYFFKMRKVHTEECIYFSRLTYSYLRMLFVEAILLLYKEIKED